MADSAFVRSAWGSRLSEIAEDDDWGIGSGSVGTDALSTISAEGSGDGSAGVDGLTTISTVGSGAGSDNGAGDSTTGEMEREQAVDSAGVAEEADGTEGADVDGIVEIIEVEAVGVAEVSGMEVGEVVVGIAGMEAGGVAVGITGAC